MRLSIRVLWALAFLLATALSTGWSGASDVARAQPPGPGSNDEPIFKRFSTAPKRQETRLRIFELPVGLRPQTDPQAERIDNLGLGYEVGIRPFDRVFVSLGFNWGRMAWAPTGPIAERAEVKQIDVSQSLNFWVGRLMVISVGFGVGLMDGLVVNRDGSFEHSVVPYIPARFGVGALLGDTVWVGLRLASTPFFAQGHAVGQSRLLLGLGWVY